jgi:hypothetical protein
VHYHISKPSWFYKKHGLSLDSLIRSRRFSSLIMSVIQREMQLSGNGPVAIPYVYKL